MNEESLFHETDCSWRMPSRVRSCIVRQCRAGVTVPVC